MRALLPLLPLLAACGGDPHELWWLSADHASAEVGASCVGHPLHETWALAEMWTGEDVRLLEVDGRVYEGPAEGYALATLEQYNSGRSFAADFDLELAGGVLEGEWRVDETTSGTCSRAIPVRLHPVDKTLGTWELSGSFAESSVSPEGCRGELGEEAFAVLLTAWQASDGSVGAWMSPDPIQGQVRSFGGSRDGEALDLHWGGVFDTAPDPNTWELALDPKAGSATLVWTASQCSLTLPMTAEAR